MRGPRSPRLLILLLLSVCLGLAGSAVRPSHLYSQPAASADFARQAAGLIAHGKRTEAEQLARSRGDSDPDAAVVLAQLASAHGRYADARAILEAAAKTHPDSGAPLELAIVDRTIGRNADATAILERLFDAGSDSRDPAVILRTARAAHLLGRKRDANTLYREAERAGADSVLVESWWGQLFLDTYNSAEAAKSFKGVLQADPEWAPAHLGLARALADDDPPAASAEAAKALEIDPDLADARVFLASLHLDADRRPQARDELQKALAVNPSHLEAHALVAAMAFLQDDKAAFDREVAATLAIDPAYSDVYRIAGEQAASNYRFADAVALTEKALAMDPTDAKASADLGMHLLRTGDEPGARRALDGAFRADPFNTVTYNLLQMLDKLDQFATVKDGDITFRMSTQEAPVLQEYAIPLTRAALKALAAKYQFTPSGPLFVEIFPDHDDFAVRNVGQPGMLGALGACFGHVVTMDSPTARNRPGSFSWEATLWHELTHVVTLQMSNQRIPRWLTEGISVYEEGRARPEWGRDMEVTFAQAMNRGKTLKLRDLNSGFTRPDTIALAYYEASLLVDHIVSLKGQPGLNALVKSFADGIDTEAAITKTLGVSIDDLQESFSRALEDRFGAMRRALADPPPHADAIASLRTAAAAKPNSFLAQLAFGKALADAGDAAAYEPLERAAALVPPATGSESPHALMAALAEKLGDSTRARKEYETLIGIDHTNIDAARKLATLALAAGDDRQLALASSRVVSLDPFDAAAHSERGRLAFKTKDAGTAVQEFRAALAAGASDKAAAHCDLGESYLLANRPADAKKEALAALEIAPSYERAQELLLNAIERHS
jgi:tetratricopeptide (TPR) repeat protein